MVNVDLPFVHKLDEHFDVGELDVAHYHDWVLFLVLREYCVEVRAACGQDHLWMKKKNNEKIVIILILLDVYKVSMKLNFQVYIIFS